MSYTLESYTVLHHPTSIKLKVEIISDDNYGPPEQEHDGHGVIMEFDYDPTDVEALIEREGWDEDEQCSPEAMEAVARARLFKPITTDSRHGRFNKYYDVWETLKIAGSQWGLPADDPDELTRVVIADYEYVNGWYNDDWCWAYAQVTPLDAEGEELTLYTQSMGSIEHGLDGNEEHVASLVNELVRQALAEYNTDQTGVHHDQLELIPVWEGLKGEVTRLP
jgi:hypothetical protein